MDEDTGELLERRPEHVSGEARNLYANPPGPVRVGIEPRAELAVRGSSLSTNFSGEGGSSKQTVAQEQ